MRRLTAGTVEFDDVTFLNLNRIARRRICRKAGDRLPVEFARSDLKARAIAICWWTKGLALG